MIIHLATDHAGFAHKQAVYEWLTSEGFEVIDHGAFTHEPLDDYPDYISLAAQAVSKSPAHAKAIIFGGSGQGEAIVANRYHGVRAGVVYADIPEIVVLNREHNDANVLSIGARFLSIDETKKLVWLWLQTEPLPDPKHVRRNGKIDRLVSSRPVV